MAEFGVLGPLQVLVDDRPVTVGGPRQRRLLAALLMRPGRVVSLDRLVEAVFDGRPSDRAEATLRSYATRLRQSLAGLGRDVVVRDGTGYRLNGNYADYWFVPDGEGQLRDDDGVLGTITLGTLQFDDGPERSIRVLRAEFCYERFVLFAR